MGGLHRREGDQRVSDHPAPATPRRPAPAPTPRLSERDRERQRQYLEQVAIDAAEYARSLVLTGVLDYLARSLSVPAWTLEALGCGWWQLASGHEGYTWPVRDGDRRVIGVATRSPEGEKAMLSGSRPGLFVSLDLDLTGDAPLYLPEGPSDTCTLLAMGLAAVGRPSNQGGAEHLAQMLRDYRGPIIIIADNDRKPDGTWPGLDGARRLARQLRQLLGREVWIALPPGGHKDVRAWLNAEQPDLADADALRRLGWALEEQLWAGALTVEQADAMLAIAASDGATEASALPLTDPAKVAQQALAQAANPPADTHDPTAPRPRGPRFPADKKAEKCPHCHGTHLEDLGDPALRQILWLRCWRNTCPGCWRRKRRGDKEQAAEHFVREYAAGRSVRIVEISAAECQQLVGRLRKDPTRLRLRTDSGRLLVYFRADLGPEVGTEFADAEAAITHMAAAIDAMTADGAPARAKRVTFCGGWKPPKREQRWRRLSGMPHGVRTTCSILDAHGIEKYRRKDAYYGPSRLSLRYRLPEGWTGNQTAALDDALSGSAEAMRRAAGRAKTVYIPLNTPTNKTVFAGAPPAGQSPDDDWGFVASEEPPD